MIECCSLCLREADIRGRVIVVAALLFGVVSERLMREAELLFDNVVDDFHEVHLIMSKFERWKREQGDSYEEAYIGLCLPKLFTPLIRLKLVDWNPLEVTSFL